MRELKFTDKFREEADFINNLYGLGDLDHDTALEPWHIYELMKEFAQFKKLGDRYIHPHTKMELLELEQGRDTKIKKEIYL